MNGRMGFPMRLVRVSAIGFTALLAGVLASPTGTGLAGDAGCLHAESLPTDESMPRTLDQLFAATQRGEIVPVIVGFELDVRFRPEGQLDQGEVASQRAAIADMQRALVDIVIGRGAEETALFETIPFLGLLANRDVLESLQAHPGVTSVVEDVALPPLLADSIPLIGADRAWHDGVTGERQVVVIFDTGVDSDHPTLKDKVEREACFSAGGGKRGSTLCPSGQPRETGPGSARACIGLGDCGHGTHVAAIAAGSDGGVAPGAHVFAVQVFTNVRGQLRSWATDRILAFEHVLQLAVPFEGRIAAINLSLGGGRYTNAARCDSLNKAEKAVVDNLRSIGIVTIAASGNDGFTHALAAPACVSSVISVGSTTKHDEVSGFTNSAAFLDFLAPGSDIVAAAPGHAYETRSGTSMAAPHVTGAWAILRAWDRDLPVDDILGHLKHVGTVVTDPRPGANGRQTPRIVVPVW